MRSKYTCPLPSCRRSYVNSSILKRHIQAFHNTEKRFQCLTCGKCLASQQNLKEHSYIHTGEKPYLCPYQGCGAKFRQGTHLSSHKKNFHEDLGIIPNIDLELNFDLIIKKLSFKITQETNQLEDFAVSPQERLDLPLITGPNFCNIPNIF